ncbi:hypothetical protein [Candidatus Methanoperedens nitratireducens]|uniref:Uncharacterized protein n=1 Tax=Candidatus Methanoperedens nitratireducens TaxID=1392998 RepID=A0A284VT45_9EURY|nr:hypothetical protein [Candidatus Methanoperedens nitroreducens]SNQ62461.1 hypothetical protein MNV_740012 [Candidatus Methanoperedens nitroreducens]
MSDVFRFTSLRPVQRAADKDVEGKIIKAYGPPGEESPFHQALLAAVAGGGDVAQKIVNIALSFINPPYLFIWDDIVRGEHTDTGRLLEFLARKFGIGVTDVSIEIDGDVISLNTETNKLSLELNDKKTEVSLKIDDGRTDKFVAKMENGKLNINESPEFISNFNTLEIPLVALDKWLINQGDLPDPNLLIEQIKSLTGMRPEELVDSVVYKRERRRVADSLLALIIAPKGMYRLRAELLRMMYLFGLLERLAIHSDNLKRNIISTADDIYQLLSNGIVLLPQDIFPLPAAAPPSDWLTTKASQENTSLLPAAALARSPGFADLMVVRQELKRYEMGEVAHIESVLKGESKERVHKRATTTEEIITIETERSEEIEQDVQSTNRFELQKEASQTIHEDSSLEVGVTVNASYGPSVSVTANMGYATNHSKDESAQVSSSYAQDVTERSASRIQERVREERITRTKTEVEETNKHGVDNSGGSEHVVGIYRWVDKVYKAQVFNYGRRLLLEFNVPEPAAFFKHVLDGKTAKGVTMIEPELPVVPGTNPPRPLSPKDITENNYLEWVGKYYVSNVSPPPEEIQIASFAYEDPAKPDTGITPATPARKIYKAIKEIKIPDGYYANNAKGTVYLSDWLDNRYLTIGKKDIVFTQVANGYAYQFSTDLDKETKELAVVLMIENTWGYALNIEVTCKVLNEVLIKWQLATYEAIMRAYFELKAQYDEQVAAAATRQGITIQGQNPLENRNTERNELKKAAITMLTGEHFESYGAIQNIPPQNYPEIDVLKAQADGEYIQFFEQAFEWHQMTYIFYPYFWGRKDEWINASQRDDPDPIFTSFLRAGTARVIVPVRPGFEQGITLYLATGMIWNGGKVPQVDDSLYVSIVQELQEQQGAEFTKGEGVISISKGNRTVTGTDTNFKEDDINREILIGSVKYRIADVASPTELTLMEDFRGQNGSNVPYSISEYKLVGEPWEVRLPTTLVILQEDATLPDFMP